MNGFVNIFIAGILDPRRAGKEWLAGEFPVSASISGIAFFSLVSLIISFLVTGAEPVILHPELPPMGPIHMAIATMLVVLTLGVTVKWSGQIFEGRAGFAECYSILFLLQFMQLGFQICVIVIFLLLPPLAGILQLGILLATIFIWINLIEAAHGFEGFWRGFLVAVMSFVMMIFMAGFALLLLSPFLPGIQNL